MFSRAPCTVTSSPYLLSSSIKKNRLSKKIHVNLMKIVYTKANPNKIADQHRKSINNLTGDCKNPRSGFYSSIIPGTKPTNIKTIELIRTHC